MIGALNARAALERPDGADDGGGGRATVWTVVDVVWAAVTPRRARESAAADALTVTTRVDIRLRWRGDVRPGWRLTVGERLLRVVAATDPDGRRRWLDLVCEEEVR